MKPLIFFNDKVIGQSIAGTAFYVDLPKHNNEFFIPKTDTNMTWIPVETTVMAVNAKTKYIKTKSLTFKSTSNPICIETSVSMNSFLGELDFEFVNCQKFIDMVDKLTIIKFKNEKK